MCFMFHVFYSSKHPCEVWFALRLICVVSCAAVFGFCQVSTNWPFLLVVLQDVDLRKTVDESARIQRAYSHYFDLTIVNDNLDKAFETLQAAVETLCTEPQWVPVNWVYWGPAPTSASTTLSVWPQRLTKRTMGRKCWWKRRYLMKSDRSFPS